MWWYQSMGMLENREYAKILWYTVSAVVGLGTIANIFARIVTWSR